LIKQFAVLRSVREDADKDYHERIESYREAILEFDLDKQTDGRLQAVNVNEYRGA
jgi:hypothetical protein